MTTTPARKHSRSRRCQRPRSKPLRHRSLQAFRYWQYLTRCCGTFRRRITAPVSTFRFLRRVLGLPTLALWLFAHAHAENFVVTTNADPISEGDDATSLREAIALANANPGPDTITFAPQLSGQVVTLTEGELAIHDDLSIDASNLAEAPVIDADRKSRVIHFSPPEGDLVLSKIVLRNGWSGWVQSGGGIWFASSGSLTLTNSTVSGNSAHFGGGGIFTYSGAVTLNDSTLTGNSAWNLGGGGIATVSGTVTLNNSTVSNTHSDAIRTDSGAVTLTNSTVSNNGSGICTSSGAVTLTNSTVRGNSALYGGGIYTDSGAVTLTSSTVSGNLAHWGGGGIYTRSGAVALTDSTVSGNTSTWVGGGIAVEGGPLTITNSIIAGNSDNGAAPDISAPNDPANDLEVSYSLIGNSTGASLDEAKVNLSNLIDVDPLLEPLASNGGPTQTHALRIGSPAIDQGHATGTDQRGAARIDNPNVPNAEGGNGSDIGAFERSIPLIVSDSSDVTDEDFSAGNLSLREALALANGNDGPDIINFADHLSGAVITLTQGELAISDDLTIDASNLAEPPLIDADQKSRVMHFTAPEGVLVLSKLILRNGWSGGRQTGGGILFASSGSLTLTNSTVSGNSAHVGGGGICSWSGAVTLNDSTLSGNSAWNGDGGICTGSGAVNLTNSTVSGNSAASHGGGIGTRSGAVILTNSTVSGNSASYGGGIGTDSGAITLTNSTVSGNSALYGGGTYTSSGTVTLTNSTVCGNYSTFDGGGICSWSGAVNLTNSTLSGNSTYLFGGGGIAARGSLTITNSIIAGNSDNGTAPDVQAPDDPATNLEVWYSLIGQSTGAGLAEAKVNLNNLSEVDPRLGPLSDNGGPTRTMLPFPGSPVIDAGGPTDLTTDQRGFERSGSTDIGAVEYQHTGDILFLLEADVDGDGNRYGIERAVGTDPFLADSADPRNLIRPVFNSQGHAVLGFGLAAEPLPGTHWILERSSDLQVFEEVYRFDRSNDVPAAGFSITVQRGVSSITVTDEDPPDGSAFYRLRATLQP